MRPLHEQIHLRVADQLQRFMANNRTLQAEVVEQSKLYVRTTFPQSGGTDQTVALPGTLQGFVQAPIAARASGYLKQWHKDIGSRVRKGDLLAEIDSPEIDQQLSQAVAARDQTAASLQLALSSQERWEALRKKDAVSQQELDERRGAAAQARANLAAAEANVERLKELQAFKRVVAPFAGIITRRNVDVGDLIDAGGGAGRTMAFSLRLAGVDTAEMQKRVEDAAQILGLTDYLHRYPRQLSGGQRQRVAMGRAIVRKPRVFLFDEPLSNLDAKLRVAMRTEIKALHQRLKTTSVYVTHDQIEAMTGAVKE